MILTILGGGGFRVPLVHAALLADRAPHRVTQLRLYDTDASKLAAIAAVCAEQAQGVADAPRLSTHTDLVEAIKGTDFVFTAIREGGLQGRSCDERLPLERGVIGQETVGAGGIAYALRTIPVMLNIARQIRDHAPEAWVINFTNPAGVVTEALTQILGNRVVGICDSPVGLARRALKALDLPSTALPNTEIDYIGLNHLGWIRTLRVDGKDVLPDLIHDAARVDTFEEGRLFGAAWLSQLGALPNEYLHHYYFTRDDLEAEERAQQSRALVIAEQQRRFFGVDDPTAAGALDRWDACRLAREETYMATNREAAGQFERDPDDLVSGGYDKVALAIMHAIAHNQPATLILNVPNAGRVKSLDDEAVIEAPCLVDAAGIHPLPTGELPIYGAGLVHQVKYVERLTIHAAMTGEKGHAWQAIAEHPLVDSVNVARRLLDDFIDAHDGLSYLR